MDCVERTDWLQWHAACWGVFRIDTSSSEAPLEAHALADFDRNQNGFHCAFHGRGESDGLESCLVHPTAGNRAAPGLRGQGGPD